MTTETTGPISVQRSAIRMADELADQFADLPNAFIVINRPWKGAPARLALQLDTPSGFEQWRTALGIEPDAVFLYPNGPGSWVLASTERDGIEIQITAHGILLTEAQLLAPRARDEASA